MNRTLFTVVFLALALTGCRSSILDDPSTMIQYVIEQPSYVRLEIENSYNTVIAVPVDGLRAQGTYSVSLDASRWLEGVYYYTLECRGTDGHYYFKSTRQMLLIKR